MKRRFILYRRKRGGMFYLEDTQSKKQESLHTKNRADAVSVLNARNESTRQPQLNLQIAKAYLSGTDSSVTTRTWQTAIESLTNSKSGANQHRWRIAARDKAFAPLLPRVIIETPGELLLNVIQAGTVSTNVYLRRLHNFCVDMNWLPWPLVPKRQWPAVKFKEKRAITLEEHQKIIAAEVNPERKALCHPKLCIRVALFSVRAQEPKPLIEAFLFCEVFQLTFNFRWNCRVCDCCAR